MRRLGFVPTEPHIECDGCRTYHKVARPNGMAYAWFLDGKAPPGWLKTGQSHWCPKCRKGKKAR